MLDLAVPLAKDVWPKLATKAISSVLDKIENNKKKPHQTGQGAVRAVRGLSLFTFIYLKWRYG